MVSAVDAVFLIVVSAVVIGLYIWNDARGRSKSRQLLENQYDRDEKKEAFFCSPTPLPSITPDTLNGYRGERDHIYVNKVLRHPYYQTMAHQPMQPEDWIEVDADYIGDLERKAELIRMQGKVVLDVIEDDVVKLGCQELMEHICDWITIRYPGLFEWQPGSERKVIKNLATNDNISLYEDKECNRLKSGKEALYVVSRLVQDDFLIASPLSDGHWLCAGGIVAFPGFYLLSQKINTTLFQTHLPVPQFNEKLLASVERTLTRLEPSKPIERTSWELVDSETDQFWVPMAGPLPRDSGAIATSPHHLTGRSEDACKEEDASQLILRLDHQTFVKMPKSGIVFFGVHPFRRKLEKLRHSPMLPRLLLDIHENGPADLMKYKAAPEYEGSVIPYLKRLDEWQRQNGLVQQGDKSADFRMYQNRAST